MSTSSYLYGQASVKAMRAERCRAAADALDRRRAALTERHRPVVALHTEAVWKGRAATSSRMRLHRVIGAALYSLGLDLATTSRALWGAAEGLDREAAALRSQARAAAAADARAARAEAEAREARAAGSPDRVVDTSAAAALWAR